MNTTNLIRDLEQAIDEARNFLAISGNETNPLAMRRRALREANKRIIHADRIAQQVEHQPQQALWMR